MELLVGCHQVRPSTGPGALRLAMAVLGLCAVPLASCGDDSSSGGTSDATSTPGTPTTAARQSSTTSMSPDATPVIWPGPDVEFETPEAAATDFVTRVLDVPAELSPFRSAGPDGGEIDVVSGESPSAVRPVRSTLRLRTNANDGWSVVEAVNENASVTSLEPGASVPRSTVGVSGVARGFEGSVGVSAFVAGRSERIDEEHTLAGSMGTAEPFQVSLDLSGASPGDVVVLLVRGDVGLETDPGDFGAIPVIVDG